MSVARCCCDGEPPVIVYPGVGTTGRYWLNDQDLNYDPAQAVVAGWQVGITTPDQFPGQPIQRWSAYLSANDDQDFTPLIGREVVTAYVNFDQVELLDETFWRCLISGQIPTENAEPFTAGAAEGQARTAANVLWTLNRPYFNEPIQSPNIAVVVQEMVDHPDFPPTALLYDMIIFFDELNTAPDQFGLLRWFGGTPPTLNITYR